MVERQPGALASLDEVISATLGPSRPALFFRSLRITGSDGYRWDSLVLSYILLPKRDKTDAGFIDAPQSV